MSLFALAVLLLMRGALKMLHLLAEGRTAASSSAWKSSSPRAGVATEQAST